MKNIAFDHGYGVEWKDILVERRERYRTATTDFHEHDFYEINLIMSGNIKVVVENMTVDGTDPKIVLTKPGTSHFLTCNPSLLYKSVYLVFSKEFIKTYDVDFNRIMSVFGENGAIYTLSDAEAKKLENIINEIDREVNLTRQKLLSLYLFSVISDVSSGQTGRVQSIPQYVYEALTYIDAHLAEKITAQTLAEKVHVGRTTLMTEFKRHTGATLNEYIVNCRLRNAIKLLLQGKTEFDAAISSGYSDACSLIQSFKRVYQTTPKQYIKSQSE